MVKFVVNSSVCKFWFNKDCWPPEDRKKIPAEKKNRSLAEVSADLKRIFFACLTSTYITQKIHVWLYFPFVVWWQLKYMLCIRKFSVTFQVMNWCEIWHVVQNTRNYLKQDYQCSQHMQKQKWSRDIAEILHFFCRFRRQIWQFYCFGKHTDTLSVNLLSSQYNAIICISKACRNSHLPWPRQLPSIGQSIVNSNIFNTTQGIH